MDGWAGWPDGRAARIVLEGHGRTIDRALVVWNARTIVPNSRPFDHPFEESRLVRIIEN